MSLHNFIMFIFRMIKRLFFLVFFCGLVFWGAHYKVKGRPVYKIAQGFLTSEGYREGMKDIKLFLGGFLKTMGEQIQENVTQEDQKKLDKMIKEKVKEGAKK